MTEPPPRDYTDAVPFPREVTLTPIGIVHSPYTERYGTPRQGTVVQGVVGEGPQEAVVELFPRVVPPEALRDLAAFERVWLVTWLHLNKHWKPMVVPPRGPKVKRGVLATRAPHRPNQLGLTCSEIVGVEGHRVTIRGHDLLDGTPVLDLKPYIPYADAFPEAGAGWLDDLDQAHDAPDRPTKPPPKRRG